MSWIKKFLKRLFRKPGGSPRHAIDNSSCRDISLAIAHAKEGYKNAQETIRFIDTKSGFLAGMTVLAIGATLDLAKRYLEFPLETKRQLEAIAANHPNCTFAVGVFATLSLVAGVWSLWSSALSLVGRPPKQDWSNIHTALFPFFSGSQAERRVCERLITGTTETEVILEYENQLWNVGLIIHQKLHRHRWAMWMFLVEIILLVAAGITFFWCVVSTIEPSS